MNVTREVVTDLLPIYFSGEASGDTKVLVEDYFRQDPDFERIARSAAMPLETLRAHAPIAASREKEKRDLESVRRGLWRRRMLFGGSLFLTPRPVVALFHPWPYRLSDGSRRPLGSGVSLELRGAPLVPLFVFRAAGPARSVPGGCDLINADTHSLRLALCLRWRVSGRVRGPLDLCGMYLDRVFQAAPLLGLLRMLVRGLSIAARPRRLAKNRHNTSNQILQSGLSAPWFRRKVLKSSAPPD